MNSHRILKAVKILCMVAIAITAFGFVTQHLWNWLMPQIFGLNPLTLAQAIGLVVLSKILFGGFHRHGAGRGPGWRRHMEDRFANMTPEERERFRAGMGGRRSWCRPSTVPVDSAGQTS
jgi:hypothetical protein